MTFFSKFKVQLSAFMLIFCIGYISIKIKSREIEKTIGSAIIDKSTTLITSFLDQQIHSTKKMPDRIEIFNKPLKIEYTFKKSLMSFLKNLLHRYRSDFTSIIIIDNQTGSILGALGYQKKDNSFNYTLPFTSTHPSASLIKIITSAELLQNTKIGKNSIISFRGRGNTLYKYQLRPRIDRWTRHQSLKTAFAYSNNVVFGKAAIENIHGISLLKMAFDFGFNQTLMRDITVGKSIFSLPKNQYNLAELASGFNRETTMSPIHAAVIASIVANNGKLNYPKIISKVINLESGKNIWNLKLKSRRVLSRKTTKDLQEMMELVVSKGTAKGGFRHLKKKLRRKLLIGGKTGSITGGLPLGKRDWFTAYAIPKDSQFGKGISISVMNINKEKWYVKSTLLAKEIIEYYFKKEISLTKPLLKASKLKIKTKKEV